jgi:hypothetical protein
MSGALTWELERDLYLASQGASVDQDRPLGPADIPRLEQALDLIRQACDHAKNVKKPDLCWKCGAAMRPGLRKTVHVKVPIRKLA